MQYAQMFLVKFNTHIFLMLYFFLEMTYWKDDSQIELMCVTHGLYLN